MCRVSYVLFVDWVNRSLKWIFDNRETCDYNYQTGLM